MAITKRKSKPKKKLTPKASAECRVDPKVTKKRKWIDQAAYDNLVHQAAKDEAAAIADMLEILREAAAAVDDMRKLQERAATGKRIVQLLLTHPDVGSSPSAIRLVEALEAEFRLHLLRQPNKANTMLHKAKIVTATMMLEGRLPAEYLGMSRMFTQVASVAKVQPEKPTLGALTLPI